MQYLLPAVFFLSTVGFWGVLAGDNTITDEVFFDVKVEQKRNQTWKGRFVVGVFGDALPITSFNFVSLAKGFRHGDQRWTYKNCKIHRIVADFLIQTGDVLYRDGRSGRSVYAPFFIDEGFEHSHRAAGYVAMANSGKDTNNSQFYVTLAKARWLDHKNVVFGKIIKGMSICTNNSQFYVTLAKARWLDHKNVVFGKIIKGMDIVQRLSELKTNDRGFPRANAVIAASGILPLKEPYDLSEEELDKNDDIRPDEPAKDEFVEL